MRIPSSGRLFGSKTWRITATPVLWSLKKIPGVYFDENGLVTAGTIKEAAPWKTGGTVTTLTEKTEYKFTENGAEKTPETNPSE